jgi:hypothetical protein
MNRLPFLNTNKVPKLRKLSGISKYGFSEDDELIEQAIHELSQAIENKDYKQMMNAIEALVDCIMNKENEYGNDEKA